MNFKDVAHKTVAELFDMLKAKVAAIKEMDEVIKLQDADLRKYEKQIDGLKEQLNNMEACYIRVKGDKAELLGVISDALEAFNDGEFNYCQKQLEMHAKPLRGADD